MRDSVDITKKSAVNIAKWRISELLKTGRFGVFESTALKMALANGGAVEQIADILYECGLKISVDKNDPDHQLWLKPNEQGVAAVYIDESA